MLPNADQILSNLRDLQQKILRHLLSSRSHQNLHEVNRTTAEDTIYNLDLLIEPLLDDFFHHWSKTQPLIVIAEGLTPESGRLYPSSARESDAQIRIILDPIDGTRGLMYDKRPAWSLAAAAPNKGPQTRLSDIDLAIMTELPTTKMHSSDILHAIKGHGAHAHRQNLFTNESHRLQLNPSRATNLSHGFASIANFFPGTKLLAAELSEFLAQNLLPPEQLHHASLFEDQYISTGGQLYELIVGHDRFTADLRSLFYKIMNQPPGMCVHPYDICTQLIAHESGVILTNALAQPLDSPLDLTTPISFAAFANETLRHQIEPLLLNFLGRRLPK